MTVQIPAGYKQTEVGVIPEDWSAPQLGEIIETTQLGGNYKNSLKATNYPLIKMGNLSRGFINTGKIEYIQSIDLPSEKDKLYFGDVLFNTRNTLELVGKVAIWRGEISGAYFNSNIMRIKFDENYVSSNLFMNVVLNTSGVIEKFRGIATGTTSVAAIYNKDLLKVHVPLPTKKEQQAIAEALSDADALIESLEQLIAKKRQIKQGAMQELLTGQRRLPGFSGEWKKTTLGKVANIKTGSKNNQDKIENGEYPFFVRSAFVERINNFSYDCEAILVPGEGGIGSIFHYIDGKFDVHQRVYAITQFDQQISGKFVYYYMRTYFGAHAMENSVKATVDSLRLPTFQDFEISLPTSLDEQNAISLVMSEMEAEVGELESRLAKARQIKQGMMQELLTGRIRLI